MARRTTAPLQGSATFYSGWRVDVPPPATAQPRLRGAHHDLTPAPTPQPHCTRERFPTVRAAEDELVIRQFRATLAGTTLRPQKAQPCEHCGGAHLRRTAEVDEPDADPAEQAEPGSAEDAAA